MSATVLSVDRGVATITLARPDNRNALSTELVDSLGDDLAMAVADDDVRVIVLTNEGTVFCAGADLRAEGGPEPRHDLVGILSGILDSPKPVIGRIAGHCMGGGVGLAAACDISVIADDARVGFTEVRIGVAPAMISVVCLPKLRRADASELFLSGERIPAARAVEVGLLNRCVPPADLDAAVGEVVEKVVAGGPEALAASKRLINDVPGLPRDEAFDRTRTLSAELFGSDEAAAGIRAWREKAPAPWIPGD
jgi:methylglutaconyl-CoA hydratase